MDKPSEKGIMSKAAFIHEFWNIFNLPEELCTDGEILDQIHDLVIKFQGPDLLSVYEVPVTWEVCGTVKINATSPEDALAVFKETKETIPLPEKTEYFDGSFQLTYEDDEDAIVEMLLPRKCQKTPGAK